MATKLEETLAMIAEGLTEEAMENLRRSGAIRTGFLRDSINTSVSGDDFIINFADYGVFVDQGTEFVQARPFVSNLVVDGSAEGTFEDEIEEMTEEAFCQDVEDLNEIFEE